MWGKAQNPNEYLKVDFSKRLYIKSCALGHTERAYLNSRQQCPLTSGWTMLNSLCLIRWLTLQRRQGRSLICNWVDGGQTHRISSTHWVLQLASVCACLCVRVCERERVWVWVWDCSMLPKPPRPCKPERHSGRRQQHIILRLVSLSINLSIISSINW